MSSIYAEFGGNPNAVVASGELTEHEKAMVGLPVSVRDGDDLIQMDAPTEEEEDTDVEAEAGGTEPEVEQEVDTDAEEPSDVPEDKVDPNATTVDKAGEDFQSYMQEQESLISEAIAKGLPSNIKDILEAEYQKGEGFSESTYAELAKVGYSKTFVDSYVRGQDALAERFVESIYNFAGGKASFERTASFMGTHNKELAEAFNDAIQRTDVKAIKAIINTTKSQMVSMFGSKPQRDVTVKAKPVVSTQKPSVEPFASSADMIKAMSDRKYQTDASYRAEVEKRVGASRF